MSKRKKLKPPPLGPTGQIEVLTAFTFALTICVAIAVKAAPIPGATFFGRLWNLPTAVRQEIQARNIGVGIIVLFILAVSAGAAFIATSRVRTRKGPVGAGRAVVNGMVDAIVGLLLEAVDLASGSSSSSSSSSSSGGMSGGGGSFGGGGASGGW